MTRFVPRSFRDHHWNQLYGLSRDKCSCPNMKSDSTTIFPSKEKRIHYFVRRLRPHLRLGAHTLDTSERSFLDIIDHTRSLEKISHEAQGGSDK